MGGPLAVDWADSGGHLGGAAVGLALLAPFLAAGVLAWLLEPAVGWLIRLVRLPRRWAAALCVLGAAGLAGGLGALLAWRLWYELVAPAEAYAVSADPTERLGGAGGGVAVPPFCALPAELREPAREAVEGAVRGVLAFRPGQGRPWRGGAGGLLTALPSAGLFLFTAFLAAYFLLAGRPGLQAAAGSCRWFGRSG